MGRGRVWTDAEVAKARELLGAGLNYKEVGAALDRTGVAVKDAIARRQPVSSQQRSVGSPIGLTQDDVRYTNDAVRGSARLRDEILRAFPEKRAA